jgi:hypothetical protein
MRAGDCKGGEIAQETQPFRAFRSLSRISWSKRLSLQDR